MSEDPQEGGCEPWRWGGESITDKGLAAVKVLSRTLACVFKEQHRGVGGEKARGKVVAGEIRDAGDFVGLLKDFRGFNVIAKPLALKKKKKKVW